MPNKPLSNLSVDMPLDFAQWYDLNADELFIQFAESGADRELDFDFELAAEKQYEIYLANFGEQL